MRVKKGRTHFYLNKYIIALYDENDELYVVADNPRELLLELGAKPTFANINNIQNKLTRANKSKDKKIRHNDKWLKVYLIPFDDDETE